MYVFTIYLERWTITLCPRIFFCASFATCMQSNLPNKPRRSVAYKLINHRVGRVMNKITFQMYIYEVECLKVITLSFEIYISNNYHIMISHGKLETVNSFCCTR